MATITAKFGGVCRKCGGSFRAGAQVEWSKATGTAHLLCPAKSTEEVGTISWSEESSFRPADNLFVGQFRRAPKKAGPEVVGKVVMVTAQRSRYVREDGLSFGLSDDTGYIVTLWARLATPEEIAKLEAEEAAARAEKERAQAERDAEKARVTAATEAGKAEKARLIDGLVCGGEEGFDAYGLAGVMVKGPAWCDGYWDVSVKTGTLKNGAPVVWVSSYGSDDNRTSFYSTPEGVTFAYQDHLSRVNGDGAGLTPETARRWLRQYDGCAGSEFYRWLAGSDGGEVPTKAPRS